LHAGYHGRDIAARFILPERGRRAERRAMHVRLSTVPLDMAASPLVDEDHLKTICDQCSSVALVCQALSYGLRRWADRRASARCPLLPGYAISFAKYAALRGSTCSAGPLSPHSNAM
jgi:hypothetical protein